MTSLATRADIWSDIPSLSPLRFLARATRCFGSRLAVEDGDIRLTYDELAVRCQQVAAALAARGCPGDRVAALASNSHTLVELHFGIPLARQLLVAINTRLSSDEIRYILGHARAGTLIATREHVQLARKAVSGTDIEVLVADDRAQGYEQLLAAAPLARPIDAASECDPITINYTSGTTAQPKGVAYGHRGAFLQSVAMAYHAGLGSGSRYLWTLPMFHCNGWCFTWAVVAAGATHVCLRSVDPASIWEHLCDGGISHFCGAPTVLNMIAGSEHATPLRNPVRAMVGGAPPAPADLGALSALGIDVTHLYGLTETYGPVVTNIWQPEWDALADELRGRLSARQGVPNVIASAVSVVDSDGRETPADGETLGEIVIDGESVALGYTIADTDGVDAYAPIEQPFRTGDIAVRHPDGYLEIRDRAKDMVVTGGENVPSVQVEQVLASHPLVNEAAVVGAPDPHWGQVVVAFVATAPSAAVTDSDLMSFARNRLARYKVPKLVLFEHIPRNSTGKIQKHALRQRAARAWADRPGRHTDQRYGATVSQSAKPDGS